MPDVLQPNRVIEGIHQGGVALLKTDPTAARAELQHALSELPQFYVEGHELAARVHEARIRRDLGNATLRQAVTLAIPISEEAGLGRATRNQLHISHTMLEGILASLPQSDLALTDKSYATTEYGATLSFEARERVVALMEGDGEAAEQARHLFEQASNYTPGNYYYDASNTFHSARLEAYLGNDREAHKRVLQGNRIVRQARHHEDHRAARNTGLRLKRDLLRTKSGIRRSVLKGNI